MPNPRPEPAVGQYWADSKGILFLHSYHEGEIGYFVAQHFNVEHESRLAASYLLREAIYLGTLDELRARAEHNAVRPAPFHKGPFTANESEPCWDDGPEGYDWKFDTEEQATAHASDLNYAYNLDRADQGDLVHSDNSAVVGKLEAENERLRFRVEQLEMWIRDALAPLTRATAKALPLSLAEFGPKP